MELCSTIIKYFDIFGTKFTFYTNNELRLYTLTGGILSIFSIIVCILSLIFYSLNDLHRKNPISTISSIPFGGYKKIKFGKEKVWLPWRIVDYNNNQYVNHTGLLFPIIYYYSGIKDEKTKKFNLTSKIISYKLCNETGMGKESVIHQILSDYRESKTNEFFYVSFEDVVSAFRVLLPDFEIIENGKIKPVNLLSLRMLGLARQKRLQEQNKTKE